MLYIPTQLLKSQPIDFQKAFNPTSCSPELSQSMGKANELRANFLSFMQHVEEKGDGEVVETIDWFPFIEYLNVVTDIVSFFR